MMQHWFEPLVLAQFCLKIWSVLGCYRSLEGLKCQNTATFVPRTKKVLLIKVVLFFNFGHSKPLKQPKTPQILSQNCSKTTGSNDLGPMPNHFFLEKTTIGLTLGIFFVG